MNRRIKESEFPFIDGLESPGCVAMADSMVG
jgi:hypothetical protein